MRRYARLCGAAGVDQGWSSNRDRCSKATCGLPLSPPLFRRSPTRGFARGRNLGLRARCAGRQRLRADEQATRLPRRRGLLLPFCDAPADDAPRDRDHSRGQRQARARLPGHRQSGTVRTWRPGATDDQGKAHPRWQIDLTSCAACAQSSPWSSALSIERSLKQLAAGREISGSCPTSTTCQAPWPRSGRAVVPRGS